MTSFPTITKHRTRDEAIRAAGEILAIALAELATREAAAKNTPVRAS